MHEAANRSKVPEVTFSFWLIKIIATTLGETAGDAVTMSLDLGYAAGTIIFLGLFAALLALQIRARAFHPYLYWAVIIATTTAGTTLADFATRSLGIGYPGGTALLFTLLMTSLLVWYLTTGSIAVDKIADTRTEIFYWITIFTSQTLGTALGDWMADTNGFGYEKGSIVFGAGLVLIAAAYFLTQLPRALLFWAAFILTRPLGATLGDLLDKPLANGGLNIDRFYASGLLFAVMLGLLLCLPQRAGSHPK